MRGQLENRIVRLEGSTKADLPPVLHINGDTSHPRLWSKGVTRSEAEAINASTAHLRELLDNPAPNRRVEDYE